MIIYIVHKDGYVLKQTTDPMYAAQLLLNAGSGYRIKRQEF